MLCRHDAGMAAIKNFIKDNDVLDVKFKDNLIKIYKYVTLLDDTFIKCVTIRCNEKEYKILHDMLTHY